MLGLDPMAFTAGDGSMIVLGEMRDRVPPDYPVVAFLVTGIGELVDGLTACGVAFLDATPSSFAGS